MDPEGCTEGLMHPSELEFNPHRQFLTTESVEGSGHGGLEATSFEDCNKTVVECDIPRDIVVRVVPDQHLIKQSTSLHASTKFHKGWTNDMDECSLHGLFIGVVVGILIQLSCMGAFYLYAFASGNDHVYRAVVQTGNANSSMLMFSLVWSLVTTTVGFVILFNFSFLIKTASRWVGVPISGRFVVRMESHVAMGAIFGVSVAWSMKCYIIGERFDLGQSLVTLLVAVSYALMVKFILGRHQKQQRVAPIAIPAAHEGSLTNDDDDDVYDDESTMNLTAEPVLDCSIHSGDSLSKPLLPATNTPTNEIHLIQRYSLFLGFLLGGLIQISSLALHYILLGINHGDNIRTTETNHSYMATKLLLGSLVWDFSTSLLGIATLYALRSLLILKWSSSSFSSQTIRVSEEREKYILHVLESYFATGALLGVNLGWIGTDIFLGVHWLVLKSVLTLAVSLVWCTYLFPRSSLTRRDIPSSHSSTLDTSPAYRGEV